MQHVQILHFLTDFPIIVYLMFARTRGYISFVQVQWHYFKNCQWWHDALHNIVKNRRHTLPIYLIILSKNYLTKNTVTTDGFQSYEENRRLLLLIYAVILKLSTFLGLYTFLEINCSFFVILTFLLIFLSFCVFIVFLLVFKNLLYSFFFLLAFYFYCSWQQKKKIHVLHCTVYSICCTLVYAISVARGR